MQPSSVQKLSWIFISLFFLSCNNTIQSIESTYNKCNISIYSPYDCYYKIQFDHTGLGNIVVIKPEVSLSGEVIAGDSLTDKSSFKIIPDGQVKLNNILKQIKSDTTRRKTNHMHDAFWFILQIDDTEYINVYGEDKNINEILKILLQGFQNDIKDYCGFFKLFQSGDRL